MAESAQPAANVKSSTRAPRNILRSKRQIAWIKQEMLRRVSDGATATQAAKDIGISRRTVNDWRHSDPAFAEAWRHARIEQAHSLADQILDIADESVEKGDMAAVQRQRLRVDTRKWFCSKVAPKLYGDKLRVNVETELATRGVVVLPALNWDQPVIESNAACIAGELPNRSRFPMLPPTGRGE
jgi:hypothetical protein